MNYEDEKEGLSLRSSITKLPLFTILNPPPIMNSPERSGMLTPPLHAAATIPFRWEDEPGKPKPFTTLIHITTDFNNGGGYVPKSLELPPRLLIEAHLSKLPSPTTVLDGPYVVKSSRFQSLSFRMTGGSGSGGSFRENSSRSPDERGKGKKLFGSWKRIKSPLMGNKGEIGRSYVFPDRESSSVDDDDGYFSEVYVKKKKNSTRIKRVESFSILSDSKSHFWGNIYQGLKHVIVPWRGRKQKKDGFIIIN
jgi:hypothetical protein